MKKYKRYVQSLDQLIASVLHDPEDSVLKAATASALDGQANEMLRQLVSRESRKTAGAFFTSSFLRKCAIDRIRHTLTKSSKIIDPSCGAADLLIECASTMPISRDPAKTIERWGHQIRGIDLHPEFIHAARSRLFLQAFARAGTSHHQNICQSEHLFPLIRQGDGLSCAKEIAQATHVVMNPPYTKVETPEDCAWTSGKVSTAAVFLDYCLSHARTGTHIVAILPDVLRSGSRYARWRTHIEAASHIKSVEAAGQFDEHTDVDVFILHLTVGQQNGDQNACWITPTANDTACTLDTFFDVSVGSVVPHRDPMNTTPRPYIFARLLRDERSYDVKQASKAPVCGRGNQPPFVVVRRTNRPEKSERIVATIITGKESVAVENHLIVIEPKDKTLRACKEIVKNLENEKTTTWLNERIRCRHLTVSALKELPWWEGQS